MLAAPALAAASTKTVRKPAASKARRQPAETPQPLLPQELPPVPPDVTYQGGQLTIIAQNSTLFDILSAVRKATGAAVDAPASATERVATRLGPGRPREVLAALLNGSRFDFILLSPPDDPGGVRRLMLTPRNGSGATSAPEETLKKPPGALFSQPAHPVGPGTRPLPPDSSDEEYAAPEETVEPAEEVAPEPQAAPPPDVKSPEQLQEELRRQEEQQRLQQQQQQQQQPPQ